MNSDFNMHENSGYYAESSLHFDRIGNFMHSYTRKIQAEDCRPPAGPSGLQCWKGGDGDDHGAVAGLNGGAALCYPCEEEIITRASYDGEFIEVTTNLADDRVPYKRMGGA
jgi:hypothetical protein